MASTINPEYTSSAAAGTLSLEPEKAIIIDVHGRSTNKVAVVEVVLRVLLFATSLTSVVSIATSKQTKRIPVPFPPYGLSIAAELTDSPAFIYLVAALSITCLYSIITTLLSFFALIKRSVGTSRNLTTHFVMIDVLLLGIVASAAGAAGEVAYIGLKGNSNVGWQKICNIYSSYCRHVGFSVLCSIFSAVALAFLIMLSTITMTRKNSK